MDGVARAVGAGPTIKLGGETFTLNAKILRHYAEIEAEIIGSRVDPFDVIRQMGAACAGNPDLAREVVAQAFLEAKNWRVVTIGEIYTWLDNTVKGRCFRVWCSIRENDPQRLTLDVVSQLYLNDYEAIAMSKGAVAAEAWDTAISRGVDIAEANDELGNSTPSASTGESPETATASPGT